MYYHVSQHILQRRTKEEEYSDPVRNVAKSQEKNADYENSSSQELSWGEDILCLHSVILYFSQQH